MLTDSTDANETANRETPSIEDGGSRSIEAILERSRARRQRRSQTRAPGFVHGNCRLDAIGQRWVEQTAFVEYLPADDRHGAGWTVARFGDGFTTIEQGLEAELEDLEGWLAEQLDEVDRVVVLEIGEAASADLEGFDGEIVAVASSRRRIQELESHYLGIARDRDFGAGAPFSPSPSERLLESRLDVMTLICLCDQLI
ncbi:MAG: hypothetical protein ABEN55_16890 [Bradymonadaceae bacterium]